MLKPFKHIQFVSRNISWPYKCSFRIIIYSLQGSNRSFKNRKFPQVSKPSLYSGRSQQCFCLDGDDNSSDFKIFQFISKTFGTIPSAPRKIGIIFTLMFYSFLFLELGQIFCLSFHFLSDSLFCSQSQQNQLDSKFSFMVNTRPELLAWIRWSFFITKSQIIIIIYSFRVFHISVSWWFFTGVWVTTSHRKSPGFVSGIWPFSAMLSLG